MMSNATIASFGLLYTRITTGFGTSYRSQGFGGANHSLARNRPQMATNGKFTGR